jgi:putative heme iron utilization protein
MTQHASSLPPSTAPEPAYAERVRTLLESERVGTLATQSLRHPGFPFASVMPYALTAEGSPLFLISAMAIHTQNLLADGRASLLVMQSGSGADPLGAPRATLSGVVQRLENVSDAQRQGYLERHPSSRHWIDYADFSFFRLEIAHVYFVGGFGVMGWVAPEDYRAAEADPLAEAAAEILEHMNGDHADAVLAIARRFGELDADEAAIVACDRLGFVVRARTAEGMKGRRIAFPEPVRTREEARKAFVAMTRAARQD